MGALSAHCAFADRNDSCYIADASRNVLYPTGLSNGTGQRPRCASRDALSLNADPAQRALAAKRLSGGNGRSLQVMIALRGPRTAGPRGKAGHDARQKVRVAAGVPPNVHLHPAPGCKSVTESSPDKPAKLRRMRGRSQSSFIKAAKAAGYTSIKMLPDGTLVADLPHESAAVSNGAAPTDDVEQWFEQHANQS